MPLSTALHISYTVRAAVEAAVIASISTPVFPSHATVARIWIVSPFPPGPRSIVTWDIAIGWHSGIKSAVRLAAMMPAIRATPSTSPFFIWFSRISDTAVLLEKRTVQAAVAIRDVTGFSDIETM
ncbi:hypothetical protein VCV18_003127 [Metarhizium anisopliae]